MTTDTTALGSRGARSALTGAAGGAFSGLTGVGGGAVMIPLLTGPLRLTQHRAHATSLATILFIASAGVLGYWRAGNIDWRLVATLVPGAAAGVFLGARAMPRVPARELRLLFGAFLLFVAFRELLWDVSAGAPQAGATGLAIELGFGFIGGALAGMLGIGGGAVFVPAIVIFGLAHVASGEDPQKVAQGVSLVVIVCTGLVGTVTNLRQGIVDLPTVTWLLPAAVAAAFIASLFANRLDAELLKKIYGVVALSLGMQVIATTLHSILKTRIAAVSEGT